VRWRPRPRPWSGSSQRGPRVHDHGGFQHRLLIDGGAEMSLGVQGTVEMVLYRHLGQPSACRIRTGENKTGGNGRAKHSRGGPSFGESAVGVRECAWPPGFPGAAPPRIFFHPTARTSCIRPRQPEGGIGGRLPSRTAEAETRVTGRGLKFRGQGTRRRRHPPPGGQSWEKEKAASISWSPDRHPGSLIDRFQGHVLARSFQSFSDSSPPRR